MVNVTEERIKKWKNKLIDLSLRNRLLNFKPTKISTVKVINELPTEIIRVLVVDDGDLEFLPVDKENFFANVDRSDKSSIEFKAYKEDEVREEHKDKYLQTDLPKEKLSKNLLRIYSKANSVMEEQGYNVLFLSLGCLEWYESETSDVRLKAPIILVPVELSRSSVKSKFKLSYIEEESFILNPALIAKMQNDFRIVLDPIDEEKEELDPQEIFLRIKEAVSAYDRWRVTNDIYLSLFSFAKFIMYKDIEKYIQVLTNNPIIKMICGEQGDLRTSLGLLTEEEDLDRELKPTNTLQILDADSSQQQAILAVKNGKSLVVEGPPGTGKSQTIANIIAEFLAENKRVLFVSQKMAALEVVKQRLDWNGLGDFCLELHSRKTNKSEVIKELTRTLEMQQKPDHSNDEELAKLDKLKEDLNSYARAIHTPVGKFEMTPYQAFGIINSHLDIEDIGFVFQDAKDWDRKRYVSCCELLDNLTHNLSIIGNPCFHPWHGSCLVDIHYQEKLKLLELLASVINTNLEIQNHMERLTKHSCFREPLSLAEMEVLTEASKVLVDAPKVSKSILENEHWNSLSGDIEKIINTVRNFNSFIEEFSPRYNIDALLKADISLLINRYARYIKNPVLIFTVGFWKDRKKVKEYIVDKKYRPSLKYVFSDLQRIDNGKKESEKIKDLNQIGIELFGSLWKDKDTKWEELDKFSRWIIKFRYYVVRKYFENTIFEELSSSNIDKESASSLSATLLLNIGKIKNDIKSIFDIVKFNEFLVFGMSFSEVNLKDLIKKISNMKECIDKLDEWIIYQSVLLECKEAGLEEFINKIMALDIPFDKIANTFECQFLRCWLYVVFSERIALKRFRGEDHDKLIQKFCELDRKQIELAKIRLQHKLSGKIVAGYSPDYTPTKESELGILLRESRKTRAHMPIRKLFGKIPRMILELKPCLLMSPLTVAQFLNPEFIKFDLVIFDEASQIPPEDAVGAIIRGSQVVIAGDSKQLPPTSFFQSEVVTLEDLEGQETEEMLEDLDSILNECAVSGIPKTMLRWHYRSKHESLIAFSNRNFYDNHLFTFPCALEKCEELGVKFNYIPNSSYDRGGSGTNIEEAKEVAKAVFRHFKETPELTIGVGTFSIRQKYAIEDIIEEMLREDNSLEPFFNKDKQENFFIKNLETIQGDERDVILISVGYGKDPNGRLSMNFGPINQLGGPRRLNVLVTRARKRVEIFSSIRGDDFDLSRTDSQGVRLLKNYLEYAEKGKIALLQGISDISDFLESPFEKAVYNILISKGLKVDKQVGCSGYRIDLAIIDEENPGRYILGIECDGARYHSSATARDRDRLRQQVLEDLNWDLYRIWSTDWFKNPRLEIEKLLKTIQKARKGECKKN